MTKNEQAAVVRLLRRMNEMQRQISKPTTDDATDEEVLTLFRLFWTCKLKPVNVLPSKHVVERLVGWLRGCEDRDYCYISRGDVARIIREASKDTKGILTPVYLNDKAANMSDIELYYKGRWNYEPTPLVNLLLNVHANPQWYDSDGNRR